jgi:hypothetical protein
MSIFISHGILLLLSYMYISDVDVLKLKWLPFEKKKFTSWVFNAQVIEQSTANIFVKPGIRYITSL